MEGFVCVVEIAHISSAVYLSKGLIGFWFSIALSSVLCVWVRNIREMTESTQMAFVQYQHSPQGKGLKWTRRFAHSFHFIIKLCFPIKSIPAHSEYKNKCVGRKCEFISGCCSKCARKMSSTQHKAGMQSFIKGRCLLRINLPSF